MTGQDRDQWEDGLPPEKDDLEALQDLSRAYRRQFRQDVWIYGLDPERIAPTLAAMRAAMACGRALTVDEAVAITGTSPPPLGADG